MIETKESMNNVYLLTGGNEGNRTFHVQQAMANIEKYCGVILRHSGLYETAAWGITDQAAFLNQVLLISTGFEPSALMTRILEIETSMGRKRVKKYGPRTIDIDILFFNDEIIDEPGLKIPHPEIQNRRFVLEPMDEIAPGLMHPVLRKTISQLLAECPDQLDVKKI